MQFDNLDIEFTGHAGFFITPGNIYIDPYKLPAGYGSKKADIILITHSHYDHCSIEDLKRIVMDGTIIICPADCQSKLTKLDEKIKIQNIEPGQEMDVEGIKIRAVPAYNIGKKFHDKNEGWNGYIVEIGGKRIYHAGDTDLISEMRNLGDIDVAFLPVGGTYTMNAEEAFKAAMTIKPKLAIPMHFGSVVGTNEDALKFVQFCREEGIKAEVLEKR